MCQKFTVVTILYCQNCGDQQSREFGNQFFTGKVEITKCRHTVDAIPTNIQLNPKTMKKIIMIVFTSMALAACGDGSRQSEATQSEGESTPTEQPVTPDTSTADTTTTDPNMITPTDTIATGDAARGGQPTR